jgi:hypothetical protein
MLHAAVFLAVGVVTLPPPPTEDPAVYEPIVYLKWLNALNSDQRREVDKQCRADPTSYQGVCGGIGPLHIPRPPHMQIQRKSRPISAFKTMEAWHAVLSPEQRKYVEHNCAGGEDRPSSDLCGLNTPLVISFDGQPVQFTPAAAGAPRFAITSAPVTTDWPTAATPWLAIDLDGDGAISGGAELFGSGTRLPDGSLAPDGFTALAALDSNHDGRIDAADPAFAKLLLWTDRNGDRRSTPDELRPASEVIVSISLDYRRELRCDARSDCEGERAQFVWRDPRGQTRRGAVVDVYLPAKP